MNILLQIYNQNTTDAPQRQVHTRGERRKMPKSTVVITKPKSREEEEKIMGTITENEVTKSYMDAQDVCEMLGCSKRKAYYIIATLNKELQEKGAFFLTGKVNRAYFLKRWNGNMQ